MVEKRWKVPEGSSVQQQSINNAIEIFEVNNMSSAILNGGNVTSTCSLPVLASIKNLTSLDLHSNQLSHMALNGDPVSLSTSTINDNTIAFPKYGACLWSLTTLNLSSNNLSVIQGIATLPNLTYLDLSANLLTTCAGLHALPNLRTLLLPHNNINNLQHFSSFHGLVSPLVTNDTSSENHHFALTNLDLSDNKIETIDELLVLVECISLRSLSLVNDSVSRQNPIVTCLISQYGNESSYREYVAQILPQLSHLDNAVVPNIKSTNIKNKKFKKNLQPKEIKNNKPSTLVSNTAKPVYSMGEVVGKVGKVEATNSRPIDRHSVLTALMTEIQLENSHEKYNESSKSSALPCHPTSSMCCIHPVSPSLLALQDQVKQLSTMLEQEQVQKKTFQNNYNDILEKSRQLSSQVTSLSEQLQQQKDFSRHQISSLASQLREVTEARDDAKRQLATIEDTVIKSLHLAISQLKDDLTESKQQYNKIVKQEKHSRKFIEELSKVITEHESRFNAVTMLLTNATTARDQVQQSYQKHLLDLENKYQRQVKEGDVMLKDAMTEIAKLKSIIDGSTKAIESATLRAEKAEEALKQSSSQTSDALAHDLEKSQQNLISMTETASIRGVMLDSINVELQSLRDRVKEAETQVIRVREEGRSAVATEQERVRRREQRITILTQQFDGQEELSKHLEEKLETVTKNSHNLQRENERLVKTLTQKNAALDAIQLEMSHMRLSMDKLQTEWQVRLKSSEDERLSLETKHNDVVLVWTRRYETCEGTCQSLTRQIQALKDDLVERSQQLTHCKRDYESKIKRLMVSIQQVVGDGVTGSSDVGCVVGVDSEDHVGT